MLLLHICTPTNAQIPPVGIQDEGGAESKPVFTLDCVGAGIECSHSGITGTITVSGGGTTYTGGDGITVNGGTIDFDGGASPQGELGGTWASPTVDSTHSGSAHHDAVTTSGTGTYATLAGQDIQFDPITESDISDLNHIVNHDDLADMPDSSGVDTNHDTRYVAKVQTGTPATPTPFAGMLWYDTDATGSAVTSTVNIVTKTGAYTLTSDDVVVLANGTFTLTLPTAVGISGKMYDIKNIGTGTVTVDGDGTETIDDGLTAVMSVRYEAITIISDGSNWNII